MPSWNEKPHVVPTVNVNLKPCTWHDGGDHVPECKPTLALMRLIPWLRGADVARATADDYLSVVALRRYVECLIEQVSVLGVAP